MYRRFYVALVILGLLCVSCDKSDESDEKTASVDSATEPDTGLHNDSATDTSTGVDTDSLIDTGDDTAGVLLTFVNDWVDDTANALQVQGAWYDYVDYAGQPDTEYFSHMVRDGMCASGNVAQVVDLPDAYDTDEELNWIDIYGTHMGFNFCEHGEDDPSPGEIFTLGECTINPDLVNQIKGVSFELTGDIGPLGMRATFSQGDGPAPYVEIFGPGQHEVLVEDATIAWDAGQPVEIETVHSFFFILAASNAGGYDFDYCVSNVRILQ